MKYAKGLLSFFGDFIVCIFLTARLVAPERASVYDIGRSEPCVGRWLYEARWLPVGLYVISEMHFWWYVRRPTPKHNFFNGFSNIIVCVFAQPVSIIKGVFSATAVFKDRVCTHHPIFGRVTPPPPPGSYRNQGDIVLSGLLPWLRM